MVVEPLGNFAGQLIISRSWTELKNGDWTLTIVLGAMAVECEMARLYLKWNEVDLLSTRSANDADREEWEERWRKFFAIGTKLDKVSELLTGQPFDSFLSQNSGLLGAAQAQYPAITASLRRRSISRTSFSSDATGSCIEARSTFLRSTQSCASPVPQHS
jgi:hypothetical protein